MNLTRNSLTRLPSYIDPMSMDYHARFAPSVHERAFGLARSSPRADPISRQHAHHGHHQMSRSGSTSHPTTTQSNNAGGSQRRRISVACGRCRKRKIRCSGDPGDGSGCQNCKTAQVTRECLFMRVASEAVNLPSYSASSPALSSVVAPSAAHSLGMSMANASHSTPTLHSTLGSSNPRSSLAHGLGMDPKPVYQPEVCGPAASMPRSFYDIEMPGSADGQYPHQYMLSSSHPGHGLSESSGAGEAGGGVGAGGVSVLQSQSSEYPRLWNSMPTSGKASGGSGGTGSYYVDTDAPPQMMPSTSSYAGRMSNNVLSGSTSSSPETYAIFPALSSLSSSLPEGGPRTDKVLPPLPPARVPPCSDFACNGVTNGSGGTKVSLYSYADSPGPSSASHSRTPTSSHRSPTANYVPMSPPMAIPNSQRSPPSSTSVGSVGSYTTAAASNAAPAPSGSYGSSSLMYPANRVTLMSSPSIDAVSFSVLSQKPSASSHHHHHHHQQQQQQQRPETEASLQQQQYQSTPRSSGSHAIAPPLRTSSSSSNSSSSYQQTGDQHRGSMGVGRVC